MQLLLCSRGKKKKKRPSLIHLSFILFITEKGRNNICIKVIFPNLRSERAKVCSCCAFNTSRGVQSPALWPRPGQCLVKLLAVEAPLRGQGGQQPFALLGGVQSKAAQPGQAHRAQLQSVQRQPSPCPCNRSHQLRGGKKG